MSRASVIVAEVVVAAVVLVVPACGGDGGDGSRPPVTTSKAGDAPGPGDGLFPDVLDVVATQAENGTWRFEVTISSPYDTPQRYADAWRVLAPDGTELGIRELLHDHAGEQPFTRSLSGVEIPVGVHEVSVQARDRLNGWGPVEFDLSLD